MTYIPPGITYLEIQQIADQRDAALAWVAEGTHMQDKPGISISSMPMTFRDDQEAAGWAWNNLHRYRALVAQKMGMVARVEKLEGMLQDEGTIRTTLDQALNIIESADPDLATYPWAQRIAHDARAKFI